MDKIKRSGWTAVSVLALSLCFTPSVSHADPGNAYCVTPPFVSGNIPPNLLLMIDNSASMYDLAYVDQGKKHCSVNTAKSCFLDSDCASGEGTCSVFDRHPFYCYDETYSSSNSYRGYFNKDKFYYYRSATDDFAEASGSTLAAVTAVAPSTCGTGAATVTKTIANTMCVEYNSGTTKSLVAFVAKGSYLNWLTASKLDAEKQILTGGKFDGSALTPESRGCVGQGFVKDANTADFVNFNDGASDPNRSLGITFTVTGQTNPLNPSAPSTGGQTFINLYGGASFNYGACQKAITDLATGDNAEIKNSVAACLQSTGAPTGTCNNVPTAPAGKTQLPSMTCSTNSDCVLSTAASSTAYVCEYNVGQTCTGASDTTSCKVAQRNSCSVDPRISCITDANCLVTVPEVLGTCSTSGTMYTPALGKNDRPPSNASCRADSDCNFRSTGTNFSAKSGACGGYRASYQLDKGPCVLTVAADYGPCTPNYVGDCSVSAQAAQVKTSVSFQQSMQECWTIRGETHTAADNWGFSNVNTIKNQCPDIYASYKTCHNNHLLQCSQDTDCAADGTVTCDSGPDAIAAGNPALLCGTNYAGQFYTKDARGNWVMKATATDLDLAGAEYRFCGDIQAPGVTDPTDAPSDTSTTDNLPAIVSGLGVEAQLGVPIAKMRARVVAPSCSSDTDCGTGKSCSSGICKPFGLIQQFGTQLRIGAMTFNPYGVGNSTETALTAVKMTKVCSNNPSQVCTQALDCGGGSGVTCDTTVTGTETPSATEPKNYDGGRILYPIGWGYCATMTSTPCASDSDCSLGNTCLNSYCGEKSSTRCTTALTCSGTSQACIRDSAGDHATADSLVQILDGIRAEAWTPFAETFYNALGYFAAVPQANGSFQGRSALRLNALNTSSKTLSPFSSAPVDFNETLHPSEYRCQQNYILLVTDGSSTADRNSSVSSLASLYASQAGTTAGNCTAPEGASNWLDYGGTSNLPILSWIGHRQNLASFSTSQATPLYCSVHTTTPCSSDSQCPAGESCTNGRNPRDYVTTYVVFNGADNGANGVCDAYTLLSKTASNGGTTLRQAGDPQALTTALTNIFMNIAAKASSGTAASILSNSEGSGANILQAVFYPKKIFDNQTSSNWIGEMQNLWYYVDPMINHSTIREDSNGDRKLDLIQDKVVSLRFDSTDNTTYAYTSSDSNGDGVGDTAEVKEDPDLVKSVWRGGRQLWQRDLTTAPRTIYTPLLSGGTEARSGSGLMKFNYGSTAVADDASFPLGSPLAAGMTPAPNNEPALRSYLQMPDAASGVKLMRYVHGFDFPGDSLMRGRTVQTQTIATDAAAAGVTLPDASLNAAAYASNPRDKGIGVWKLGDIISSTPRIQSNGRLNSYGLASPGGYGDASYNSFIRSNEYRDRGMVYVGANDGMLHAFKLGLLDVTASGYQKATLSGTGLGEEQWAFIPKQVLPYLKYYSDPAYNHIYSVDGTTVITDASIGIPTGCAGSYYTCPKSPIVVDQATNALDPAKNTWRTVLIGGAGLGGASAKSCAAGSNCVATPTTDPADGTGSTGLGFSSYYALDITDPNHPKLLWEFSNPSLGYATSGPAIVRVGDPDKNGRWFAVFGSGPTGKIDTDNHQFMGRSDQSLKFFAVDLATGVATQLTDTYHIDNAFSGSLVGGAIDADRWNPSVTGNYKDDAILVGYTAKPSGGTDWTSGGVLRITTKESTNPADWVISPVVTDVGPVTTAISRLQDRKNRALWLYFGTGRYYSRSGNLIDDYDTRRAIFGIKDPCYNYRLNPGNLYDKTCGDAVAASDIVNQSTEIHAVGAGGWQIDLDPSTSSYGAERVVTDAVALTNGTVFITSFEPTSDICGFGGNSYLWALGYNTGDRPSNAALAGKALIQLSTGEFKEVDLSQAFGSGSARLMRRTSIPMTGKPPADAFPVVSKSANKPVKKIMHIQER